MATIISHKFRTYQANETVDKYYRLDNASQPTDYLYMTFGKNTAWANETLPPAPLDTNDYITAAWTDAIAISRVLPSEIDHVVRRVNWSNTQTYVVFDPASATAYQSDFYCVNSQNDVFLCTSTSGTTPSVEPIYDGTNTTYTDGAYTWEYLYSVSVADAQKFLTASWLPVNYGSKVLTGQNADSVNILGSTDVMVYRIIDATAPFDNLATFDSYRRVTLVHNPLDNAGTAKLAVSNALLSTTPNTANTGETIYIENRTVIYRSVAQAEELRLVLAY